MNPKTAHILSAIYIGISGIFCAFLYRYNIELNDLKKLNYSDLQLLEANNNAAIKYFFLALLLVIIAFFLLFILFKTFSYDADNNAKNFFKTLFLGIVIILMLILIIKLISIPILQLILRITVAGSIIMGFFASTSN